MSLSALLERLEAATSWEPEIDAEIALLEGWKRFRTDEGWPYYAGPEGHVRPLPQYTASVDAALALVGRVLPGWAWVLRSDEKRGFFGRVESPDYDVVGWEAGGKLTWDVTAGRDAMAYAPTPALALCAALLAAMIGEEAKPSPPSTVTP